MSIGDGSVLREVMKPLPVEKPRRLKRWFGIAVDVIAVVIFGGAFVAAAWYLAGFWVEMLK